MQLKLHVVKISCVKILDKLALAFECEILNTTETSCEKIIASYTVSLMFICLLLLVVISVSYCYYYTKHWI